MHWQLIREGNSILILPQQGRKGIELQGHSGKDSGRATNQLVKLIKHQLTFELRDPRGVLYYPRTGG